MRKTISQIESKTLERSQPYGLRIMKAAEEMRSEVMSEIRRLYNLFDR
jgi:hypothetical protein